MGQHEQTTSDLEADAFFASFIDASGEVIARVAAEADTRTGPDLDAIVEESAAFNYWDRKMTARAERRAARQRAESIRQVADATRWAHPNEAARLAPLPAESVALLPARRVVHLTDRERSQTEQYWRWAAGLTSPMLANRLKREAVVYERHQRWLTTNAAARLWRREQREFERFQLWAAREEILEFRAFKRRREQQERQRVRLQQQAHAQQERAAWTEAQRLEAERQYDLMLEDRRKAAETHPEAVANVWLSARRGQREFWNRKKRDLRWVAISESRALEIALQVYDALPPQERNWP